MVSQKSTISHVCIMQNGDNFCIPIFYQHIILLTYVLHKTVLSRFYPWNLHKITNKVLFLLKVGHISSQQLLMTDVLITLMSCDTKNINLS